MGRLITAQQPCWVLFRGSESVNLFLSGFVGCAAALICKHTYGTGYCDRRIFLGCKELIQFDLDQRVRTHIVLVTVPAAAAAAFVDGLTGDGFLFRLRVLDGSVG